MIADSEQKLQTIDEKVKEESVKNSLDMNDKKTKTMLISKHPQGKKIKLLFLNKFIFSNMVYQSKMFSKQMTTLCAARLWPKKNFV